MRSLLTLDGADSPVIMSQSPGEYREDSGGTTIKAKNPVIIFISWGSWVHLDRRPSEKDHALTMTHRSILLRCRLIALSAWVKDSDSWSSARTKCATGLWPRPEYS